MKTSGFPLATPPKPVRGYRDLIVWQRSIELVVESYRLASSLPAGERFGLSDQLRRATTSVAINIAEGHGRLGRGEFVQHLSTARGSRSALSARR
jgi:four helix bundle protein